MDDFDQFWKAYPKKLAKGDARKAWIQTEKIRPPLDVILTAITNACRTDQWMRDGGQFIPYPASWLRAERWDDEHFVSLKPKLPELKAAPEQKRERTQEEIEAARRAFSVIRRTA